MNAYYSQDAHGPFRLIDIGRLELAEGGVLENCPLAVATHGQLNAARDNAILVTTWYSGTSKIMEQVFIGPGRALDPTRYFIVVVNQIGSGLSVSPHNAPGALAGPNFPKVRIGDDVRAQHRLLTEHFGIQRLALVTGGSMGAQQTYEWAVRYPEMVARAAPIAGTACNTEHDFLFTELLMEAITTDPGFRDGHYASSEGVAAGLKRHAKLWTLMGWSTEFFRCGRHHALGFDSMQAFVDGFMTGYFAPMDPNNLLCMAWKWQRGDVSLHAGHDKAAALGRIRAKTYVMPITTDMFFPPSDCQAEQQLIPNSELRPISSLDGHLTLFGTDANAITQIDACLNELLATSA
ncbi:MAG: alpha/beta fold hydrolase [Hydrogenophaga sp.]|uniref:alpha/beta fold hydrolase n=1 Tax=Hydrogenophaga sp. TaxID=1904254 RepID=UPI0025C2A74F|nr:alpha/beta fold hydrolase [Hydrogenophaga sp.]MBT9549931.1 alpha/beta fold hydrolase [Hydrogenophaga sp.]